ncbi:MAG: glycosyl transferase [Bacteroidales bacterium]|nr:glycosyl transferase [Bacteroidales bacterium]MCF8389636.1 glycosyl transferase [Bacteroidales bacterium]
MIPKVIHYCWFGNKPLPDLAIKCINSWRKYLPDYSLKLWNETNFDVKSVPYVKEAYEAKKYAFVTDYVRLYAMYNEGGVYMDTDVEVIKSLDDLLGFPAFSGFESDDEIPTGIMASETNGQWAKEMLEYYGSDRHFKLPNGDLDTRTNVFIIGSLMATNGFQLKNGYQIYKNCMHIFPKDYFCPKSRTGLITITQNTYCIHHFAGTWLPKRIKLKKRIYHFIFSPEVLTKLVQLKRKVFLKN